MRYAGKTRSGSTDLIRRSLIDPISERGSSAIRIFRYLVVGGLAWLVDFGILMVLAIPGGAPVIVAATAGFLAGLLVNYGLSLTWVFGMKRFGPTTFAVFLGTGILGLLINDGLLVLFSETMGIDLTLSKVITTGFVLAWNYLGRLGLLRIISLWQARRVNRSSRLITTSE